MLKISVLPGLNEPELIKEETLVTLMKSAAMRYKNKTALIFGGKELSYAELDRWSDHVAAYLASRGVQRGQAVGIWHSRGPELHAAILGITKAGAVYVPVDREIPEERLHLIMEEAAAVACFSDAVPQLECPVFEVPLFPEMPQLPMPAAYPQPDDLAYILYTSGSTGKPKGIPISHRNICHLIRAEQRVLGLTETDRVYQGFSVSFDMWCEETWISFFAGATIWVADATTAKAVDELAGVLRREKITILHAVPSLLAVMDDQIPSLRIINAGGEACTNTVLNRWSKPGQNLFYNSYGPTETTVTATMIALRPGDSVTIGDPLPNYNLAVVDEQFNPLPVGQQGELVISGPGLSKGYINRSELSAAKFINKPASLGDLPGNKIYLTGDAVVMQSDGTLAFFGRMDDQVKLRGYRMELGEIETKLYAIPDVSAAAVALKKDASGQDQLIGYVTLKKNIVFDELSIRKELGLYLPVYMVPLLVVLLEEMPRLTSGKIDRKALPVPEQLLVAADVQDTAINQQDAVAVKVMAGLRHHFPGQEINEQTDFFSDLGGHSLLAASFSSWLRNYAGMPDISLRDIYTNRPIGNLIRAWEYAEQEAINSNEDTKPRFDPVPAFRHALCGFTQFVSLIFIYGLFAVQIFIPYLGYYYVVARTESGNSDRGIAIVTALLLYCLMPPLLSLLGIGAKWLLLGRVKEGDYPLWGVYYFRYWLVNTILRLAPAQFLNGTPLYPLYLRLLGTKISPDAQVSAVTIGANDLLEIGPDASLSSGVVIDNVSVANGRITFRKVTIGAHAYIGSGAVLSGGSVVEDWGELQDLSHLQGGKTITSREIWKGSPAEKVSNADPDALPKPLSSSFLKNKSYGLLYSLLLVVFPVVVLLPLLPVIMILNKLDLGTPDYDFSYFVYVPLLTLGYVITYALETVLLSRLLLWKLKPGTYPVYSTTYVRKWLSDQLISVALIVLHPVYATVFVSLFFRLLGAKVGRNTEISTASNVTHTMLEIGSESFIADAVTLGEADVRAQRLILSQTTIGNSTFVGNSALVPQGCQLADNMLIGVLSVPPTKEQQGNNPEGDWFGSPAIALPHRQSSGSYPSELTTRPSTGRRLARGLVETIRIILPESIIICCSVLFVAYCHDLIKDRSAWQIIMQLPKIPFYYLFFMGLPALLITVLLKWIVVGKYRAGQWPMWTNYVWRSEAITSTYEALAVPFFLDFLKGTPFLPMMLRLFGVRIGKRVWLNTTDITEYDMVSIGDDTALNEDCGPQTHLFEDRVMKIGAIRIGNRCSVGSRTIILYDTAIGNQVLIEPLSLVMKGEQLAADTRWTGSPIKVFV